MAPPHYLYQNGDPSLPPPFSFPGLRTRGFPLRARLDHLEAVVDRLLNIAPAEEMGFLFTPLAPLVYLTLNTYPRMVSDPLPYRDMGFITQQELMVSVPVLRWEDGVPVEVALFSPYLVVDAPWSVVTGRTVLGFPKVQGWFEVRDDLRDPYPFFVETLVFPKYTPDTRQSLELLVAAGSAAGPTPTPGRIGLLGDIDRLFLDRDSPFRFDDERLRDRLEVLVEAATQEMRIRAVQLQQIRDAARPESAAYQAITDSRMRVSMGGGGLLPPAVVEFRSYDSLDIPGTLGLGAGALRSFFPYWLEGDTVLDDTRNLYRRCGT